MIARTQVTLDPELRRRARLKAAQLGISFAEYVRRVVARDLGAPPRHAAVGIFFDLGASNSPTDVARDKDRLVADAAWAEHRRTKR
jgi:hypothetical protein